MPFDFFAKSCPSVPRAVQDARVVGTAMLDGYAYRTRGYALRYYGARMLKLRSWLGVARRSLQRLPRDDLAGQMACRAKYIVWVAMDVDEFHARKQQAQMGNAGTVCGILQEQSSARKKCPELCQEITLVP